MARLKTIYIHCLDTPIDMIVKAKNIYKWHMSPKYDRITDTYTFLGVKEIKPNELNMENQIIIDKWKSIIDKHNLIARTVLLSELLIGPGNGWSVVGYRAFIPQNGELKYLWENNEDGFIDSDEITNSVRGFNSKSISYGLTGGYNLNTRERYPEKDKLWHYSEVMKPQQQEILAEELRRFITNIGYRPGIKGHYQDSDKTCPNFNVDEFVKDYKL